MSKNNQGEPDTPLQPVKDEQKLYDAVILRDKIVEFIETAGKKLLPSTKTEILAMIYESSPPEPSSDRGCPCKYLDEPCHPRCTCVIGGSSLGCMYCSTYGSIEQRKEAAKRIAGWIKKGQTAGLFALKDTILNSGQQSDFKIECDALKDEDWECLAYLISKRFRFDSVVGIPNGGLKLADKLKKYQTNTWQGIILVVDDVLTTGKSMNEKKKELDAMPHNKEFDATVKGCVVFARGKCPEWVKPIFQYDLEIQIDALSEPSSKEQEGDALHYFREGYKYCRSINVRIPDYDEASEIAMKIGFEQLKKQKLMNKEQPIRGKEELIGRIIAAQIGQPEQVDTIQSHMEEYFKRFPSYKSKFNDLEWYHIFLDFFDKIPTPIAEGEQEHDAKGWLKNEGYPIVMPMTLDNLEIILNRYVAQLKSTTKPLK